MKTKTLSVVVGAILSLALLGAFGMNKIFTMADSTQTTVHVILKGLAYTADHVTIEYDVQGQISTPYGNFTECPVGGSEVLNGTGEKISGGDNDFIFCRPDGNGGHLVTQFFYSDFGSQKNQPQKVKITIGDVDSALNGKTVHIAPIGDFSFDVPAQPDLDSVSYPVDVAEAVSGLKMKISRVDFSPSVAKVDACLTLPDTRDWVFSAYLLAGNQKYPFEYWTIPNFRNPGVMDDRERCYSVIVSNIPDYKTFKKGELSFVIEKISLNMPECVNTADWGKIKDELAKYNVQPLIDPGSGDYCFAGSIEQITDPNVNAYLNNYIRETLKEEVQGPLAINVK